MNQNDISQRIGSNIQRYRKNLGLSKSGFANKIKMSKSQLSEYENGRKTPSTITLAQIAEELGVTLDDLYYGPIPLCPITTARNKAEEIVNCFAALADYGIFEVRNYSYQSERGYVEGAELALSKYGEALTDFFLDLEGFKAKSADYTEAEIVKKNILSAAAKKLQRLDEEEEARFEEVLPF